MTDAEIIKALECCKQDDCDNCPNDFGNCYANLAGYALDLINRQKAELDDLKRDDLPRCKDALRRANEIGMALEKENQELKAEIERLQRLGVAATRKMVNAKAEATCKGCFRFDVCDYHVTELTTMAVNECSHKLVHKADVAEVRHGEWVADDKFDNGKSSIFHCSECYYSRSTSVLYTAERLAVDDPYCKKCGAKMDGKGEDKGERK